MPAVNSPVVDVEATVDEVAHYRVVSLVRRAHQRRELARRRPDARRRTQVDTGLNEGFAHLATAATTTHGWQPTRKQVNNK